MIDRLAFLFERRPRSAEDWVVRLGRADVPRSTQAAFERWLSADARNLADYQAVKTLLRETRELRGQLVGELNMIPRAPVAPKAGRRRAPLVIAGGLTAGLVAMALVAAVAPSLWNRLADPMAGAQTYVTAVGEIRDVTLADGSTVTLDTATTLRAKVDGRVRRLALDRGAAYFAVAHDKMRPFKVAVADRQVVVTGTRFAAGLRNGRARVELLEGSVEVTDARSDAAAARLVPGDQVSYAPGTTVRREACIDPARAVAWRQRRLVFENAALPEVLAELGRYTQVRIRLADPALARQRVTAMLPLDGAGSVIDRADKLLPVTLERAGPNEVVAQGR